MVCFGEWGSDTNFALGARERKEGRILDGLGGEK